MFNRITLSKLLGLGGKQEMAEAISEVTELFQERNDYDLNKNHNIGVKWLEPSS